MASTTLPTGTLTAALFMLLAWATNPFSTHAQLPDYLPQNGLLVWLPFNGNAQNEAGDSYNGDVNGPVLTEDRYGNANSAFQFDGGQDIIALYNVFAGGVDEMTIMAWFKPEFSGAPSDQVISLWQQDNDFNLNDGIAYFSYYPDSYNPDNPVPSFVRIGFGTSNANFNTVTIVNPSQEWHCAVMTFDGANISLYMDSELVGTSPLPAAQYISNDPFAIGNLESNRVQGFIGQIDDFAIWDRAITEEEITALYTGVPFVAPCADPTACNFEQEGQCVFAEPYLDCAGNCLNDCNNNGVCDEDEVYGCKYPTACNYNPEATSDDDSCTFPDFGYDCAGNCLLDLNNNGLCDLEEVAGCTNIDAINYNAEATLDDGSCMVTCKGDFDNDGEIGIPDLLGFLASFGNQCAGAGCMDPAGCNYDPNATFDLGYCEYPAEFFNCDGAPINDADGDGIPDELEVAGCTDPAATNYDETSTDDDGSCIFGIVGDAHTCGAESVHNPELVYGEVTDIDGNTYRTIVIGNQEWMAENLTVEHYANGDPIPNVTNSGQWAGLSTGAWCYYNNDPQFECPYGKLYNWYVTIDARNVCPTGWHVPTDSEWTTLTDHLGGEAVAGGKMKSTGTTYWDAPNASASNESGFSGLPGGIRDTPGFYVNIEGWGYFWSSTELSVGTAWIREVDYNSVNALVDSKSKTAGFSVRCLRD